MRFGVLYDFRNPAAQRWHIPWADFYGATFEHMEEVERLGFHALSLCEHHGDPDGYNPGLPVTLATAASRTSTIRIGTNIIQVPFYHPVLLAEQLAVLDVVSGGRLDVGLGQVGPTFDMEFPMFGVNPRNRPSMLDEGLDIMTRAWRSPEPFSHHGKRWRLDDVWLNPKPLQDPLPVWVVAAFSEKAMDRVAGRGLDVGAQAATSSASPAVRPGSSGAPRGTRHAKGRSEPTTTPRSTPSAPATSPTTPRRPGPNTAKVSSTPSTTSGRASTPTAR
ncbi:hypothetical protein GCM10023215_58710 [Pseudonocardia yuanmonensis]|uniref:Luciferase-like domain-containing protein n=1 Tax=Pseudonocardia yuanmonensis TaxID=1095914 RepID=A0ABP8XJK3_9PSEU